jgi:hypothetical protein
MPTKLKPGDVVSCRVRSAAIVSPYRTYDEIISFVIVAVDEHGYYLFVPYYLLLKETMIADQYKCRALGIDKRYLDENIIYIQENLIAAITSEQDGMACRVCKEFFPYAEANQEDGTLICFSCRANPYH